MPPIIPINQSGTFFFGLTTFKSHEPDEDACGKKRRSEEHRLPAIYRDGTLCSMIFEHRMPVEWHGKAHLRLQNLGATDSRVASSSAAWRR